MAEEITKLTLYGCLHIQQNCGWSLPAKCTENSSLITTLLVRSRLWPFILSRFGALFRYPYYFFVRISTLLKYLYFLFSAIFIYHSSFHQKSTLIV